MRPHQESNPDQRLRRALLYPLSYGGSDTLYIHVQRAGSTTALGAARSAACSTLRASYCASAASRRSRLKPAPSDTVCGAPLSHGAKKKSAAAAESSSAASAISMPTTSFQSRDGRAMGARHVSAVARPKCREKRSMSD